MSPGSAVDALGFESGFTGIKYVVFAGNVLLVKISTVLECVTMNINAWCI